MRARLVAWQLLRFQEPLTRRSLRSAALDAELEPEDRRVLARTLAAEARRRACLRAIAEHFAERRLRPDIAAFAQVGLAQLLFVDDIPDDAAITQTADAARNALGERPARAVLALLRRAQRETGRGHEGDARRDVPLAGITFAKPVFADPAAHWLLWAEQALSLPVPIGRRWRNRMGEDVAQRLALASLPAPPIALYVARGDRDAAIAELGAFEPRAGSHPRVLTVPTARFRDLRVGEAWQRGDLVRIDEADVRALDTLAVQAGERIWTLGLRAANAAAILGRTPKDVHVTSAARNAAQGAAPVPELLAAQTAGQPFDAAFVAAPSSSTGNLGARPAERWRFDPQRLEQLAERQRALLERAASGVRPGGRLVYATQSIEPDENERRVRAFLAAHTDWSLDSEAETLPADQAEGDGARATTGGYVARLQRS